MEATPHIEGAEFAENDPTNEYDVDVETASQLLGVSTTRLSQITTRGSLSFQRRKVGFRNRLFYRKSEILDYLERQFPASAQFKPHAFASAWAQNHKPETSDASPPPILNLEPLLEEISKIQQRSLPPVLPRKHGERSVSPRTLPSALSLRDSASLGTKIDSLISEIRHFRELFTKLDHKLNAIQKSQHSSELRPSPRKNFVAADSKIAQEVSFSSTEFTPQKSKKWPRTNPLKKKS
jgi:hypothetical protein